MSDEIDMTRRASDKRQDDIERLIAIEDDPKQRALMIVLQSINRSLIANTISTQAVQLDIEQHRADFVSHLENFKRHAVNEEAIMNKGKGAWWILSAVLLVAQSFFIYAWRDSRIEIDAMKASAISTELMHSKLQSRIEHLEKSK